MLDADAVDDGAESDCGGEWGWPGPCPWCFDRRQKARRSRERRRGSGIVAWLGDREERGSLLPSSESNGSVDGGKGGLEGVERGWLVGPPRRPRVCWLW